MSNEVYANGNAIACKAGDSKVLAAFPDVCLSPPPPPAGPVPVPYPDTSFSKDMQQGSKTVQINGDEVMLKDQSYYATSPLGDEAATRSFGASILTHVITGKTYFVAWSMDVKFEDQNVDRHLDLTTSNDASYPGGTPPMTDMEKLALEQIGKGLCPCCGKDLHSLAKSGASNPHEKWFATDAPMNMHEWYEKFNPGKIAEVQALLAKAKARTGCTCAKKTKLLPEPPCNVFFDNKSKARKDYVADEWDNHKPAYQAAQGIISFPDMVTSLTATLHGPPSPQQIGAADRAQRQVNHLTPKSAGGCPTGDENLQPAVELCSVCQQIDQEFSAFQ